MNILIVSASKVKDKAILSLEAEYSKRVKGLNVLDLNLGLKGEEAKTAIEREGRELLKAVSKFQVKIALDEKGKSFNSLDFCKVFSKWQNQGKSSFAFMIGGAYGLSAEVLRSADLVWSLSPLTFPFQIARLLTVEQVYRVFCNLNGHPYHKDISRSK